MENSPKEFAVEELEELLSSPGLRAAANAWERDGAVPESALRQLAEAGFFAQAVPREYGGLGLTFSEMLPLQHRISALSASLQSLSVVHGMTSYAVARFARDEVREELLPRLAGGAAIAGFALTEEAAGSEIRHIRTRMADRADGVSVSGRKKWISFGQRADVFLVFGTTEEGGGAALLRAGSPGFSVEPVPPLLGLRASMAADLVLDDVPVPGRDLVGHRGFGLVRVATACLTLGRLLVAAGALGVAESALLAAVEHASTRAPGGVPLAEHQLVRGLVADGFVAIEAARALNATAAAAADAREPRSAMRAIAAKLAAARTVADVTRDALQIHGARGLAEDSLVARHYRDAKVFSVIEGSTEVLQAVLGADVIRENTRANQGKRIGEEVVSRGA